LFSLGEIDSGFGNKGVLLAYEQDGQPTAPDFSGRCRCCVAMPLKGDVEHKTVLVHSPPKPVSNAIDTRTHFVEMPPGTPPGFPVAKAFNEESAELDAPLASGLVTDFNAALVEQLLYVPITQGKTVVELLWAC